jgi:LacI family transcriptional regulator
MRRAKSRRASATGPAALPLDQIVDHSHVLVELTKAINWRQLEKAYVQSFIRPGEELALGARLTVGLAILKQLYELSDEVLCQRWVENPYYQYLCGGKELQYHPSFDPARIGSLPPIGDRRFGELFRECLSGTDADQGLHPSGSLLDFVNRWASEKAARRQNPKPAKSETAKPTSIFDVATLAKVSIKTVSLVLNNRPNVSTKTRAAVLEAIRTLSYRPNVFARGLASERSYLIALLYDNPSMGYTSELQQGALAHCREAGYHLVVEPLNAHTENLGQSISKLLASSGLHGIILAPPLCDMPEVIDEVLRSQTPCVRISAGTYIEKLPTIGIREQKCGYDMTAYLISLGHRRIGFIKGHPDQSAAQGRFEGYREALDEFGLPFDETLSAQGFFTFQSGKDAAEQLLVQDDPPTAIFAANDDMAAGAIVAAQRLNLKVPNDVSIAGFDDSMAAKLVWPQLTTCRQPVREMASAAVDMLLKNGKAGSPMLQYLMHELIIRDSTAPPPLRMV